MRSQDALIRSLVRLNTPRTSSASSSASTLCATHIDLPSQRASIRVAHRHFSSSRSDRFAIKWFRGPWVELKARKRVWTEVVSLYKARGEMSPSQATQVVELMEMTQGSDDWLTDEDLLTALSIATRTESLEHTNAVDKLYARYRDRRQEFEASVLLTELGPMVVNLVRALAMAKKDREAMTVCLDLSSVHEQPLLLWKALLTSYHDQGDIIGFSKVRDYMSMHSLVPDLHILNLQMESLNRAKLFDDAYELYKNMPTRYEVAHDWKSRLLALETCQNLQKLSGSTTDSLEHGEEILSKIRRLDLDDHADEVYPAILSWIVFNGASNDKIHNEILDMQSKYDITPNIVHVNAMLYAANMSENWLVVERLWSSFESRDIYSTNDTFSLRIAASVMAKDTQGAKQIFEDSKKAGYADMLDPLALQTLLAADMMGKHSDEALCIYLLQLLDKIEPFPISATTLTFLIPKLMERKQYMKLENILEKSRDRSDWNSAEVVESILQQVSSATESKVVLNASILLKNLFWNDEVYDIDSRIRLMNRLVDLQEPKLVGQMFTNFLKSKVKPDGNMYIAVLQGAKETRDYELVKRVHQSMKMDMNISEHIPVLNTLMNAYAYVHSSLTFDVWDQISRSGQGPTQASVSIVLDACTTARIPNKGTLIWRSLQRNGFRFNDNNYAAYVEMMNKLVGTEESIAFLEGEWNREGGRSKDIGRRTLTTLYNTSDVKDRVTTWAETQCPDLWASLPRQK